MLRDIGKSRYRRHQFYRNDPHRRFLSLASNDEERFVSSQVYPRTIIAAYGRVAEMVPDEGCV